MTLVLVEYVWPPEDAQKKDTVAVVGVPSNDTLVSDPASAEADELVAFQPEPPTPPNEERVEVIW